MSARERAKAGDVFWFVTEHIYTPRGSCLPEKEYCVSSGTVSKLHGDEMQLSAAGPDGYARVAFYKFADIGKRLFTTPREAALYALALTEKNDRVWADRLGEKPMRRTWEKYLKEETS